MYLLQHYIIDWGKVKTQDDLITILKSLDLSFENPDKELIKLCKFVNKSDGTEAFDLNSVLDNIEPARQIHEQVMNTFFDIHNAQHKILLDLIEKIEGRPCVLSDMDNVTLVDHEDGISERVIYKDIPIGDIIYDQLKREVSFKPV
jgi:hypothetical protein